MADPALVNIALRQEILLAAEANLVEAVKVAREAGHSWNRIAEALGMTRQSVSERFGRLVEA